MELSSVDRDADSKVNNTMIFLNMKLFELSCADRQPSFLPSITGQDVCNFIWLDFLLCRIS